MEHGNFSWCGGCESQKEYVCLECGKTTTYCDFYTPVCSCSDGLGIVLVDKLVADMLGSKVNMDHMDVYPKIIDLVGAKVAAGESFTAYSVHQELLNTVDMNIPYDDLARPSVHTVMVPFLADGYSLRLKDFGGRWDAWEYYKVPTQPELLSVDSSSIESIGFDPNSNTLWIEFVGGRLYRYNHVPPKVFVELLYADSKGKYFNANVRDKNYLFEEV